MLKLLGQFLSLLMYKINLHFNLDLVPHLCGYVVKCWVLVSMLWMLLRSSKHFHWHFLCLSPRRLFSQVIPLFWKWAQNNPWYLRKCQESLSDFYPHFYWVSDFKIILVLYSVCLGGQLNIEFQFSKLFLCILFLLQGD